MGLSVKPFAGLYFSINLKTKPMVSWCFHGEELD